MTARDDPQDTGLPAEDMIMSKPTLRPMAAAAIVDPDARDTEPAPPPVTHSPTRAKRPSGRRRREDSGLLRVIRMVLEDVG